MLLTDPNFSLNLYPFYSQVSSDWYESFSHFIPSSDFLRITRCMLPISWPLRRTGIWVHTFPPDQVSPEQGWKIHISARPENYEQILDRCTYICIRHEVAFKFLADPFVFNTIMSKAGGRESGGKFITIYPLNPQHFRTVAEDLCEALAEFKGPYILSDKRYKTSQVIYYRYGAFTGYPQVSIFGNVETRLRSPDGTFVEDGRSPFFNPPYWISDPFDSNEIDPSPDSDPYLKGGKYRIESPIQFSLTGGVYNAVDMDTGRTVIVKEARPHISVDNEGIDAIGRLKKEYRLLKRLSGTGITPEPLDLFEDWEHLFLVEEFLPGENLFTVLAGWDPEKANQLIYAEGLHKIWSNLAYSVKIAHEHNIIINDFSPGNAIISQTEERLYLIDLEGAWEVGVDAPYTSFGTEGFRPQKGVHSQSDDIYGLGRLMLSMVSPTNSLLSLKPTAKQIFLDAGEKSGRLPSDMKMLLLECLDEDERVRPSADEILDRLNQISIVSQNPPNKIDIGVSNVLLNNTVCKMLNYIKSSTSFNRMDRLFPADPAVFITNPLSIAHGAAGVAYTLSYLEGEVPDEVISWMLAHDISNDKYPPGLYLGISGIAWVFWKIGLQKFALQLMKAAADHPLLWELPDIYYGAAGFGLACLYFHRETRDEYWLEQAVKVGDWLIDTKAESDEGSYWRDTDNNVWCGYARGQSGIALYLLYLNLVSGEHRFKDIGKKALSYDLGQVRDTEDGLKIPRASTDSETSPHKDIDPPYWSDGTAGICTSLVRYWFVFREDDYKDMLEGLMPDASRDLTAFPTLFTGLAGLGNLQLDVSDFTGDTRYISEAVRIAEGILRFQIEKSDGIAFPGEQLLRISTDFGSGSSGIALFLSRLANRDKGSKNFNFLLDDLLCLQK